MNASWSRRRFRLTKTDRNECVVSWRNVPRTPSDPLAVTTAFSLTAPPCHLRPEQRQRTGTQRSCQGPLVRLLGSGLSACERAIGLRGAAAGGHGVRCRCLAGLALPRCGVCACGDEAPERSNRCLECGTP